jgi:sterol desaturase/sphingolipid hydroxylase (fatty acid hydroxylase superfamily)
LNPNAFLGLALIAWFVSLALAASLIVPLANVGAAATGEWAQIGLAHHVALPLWGVAALLLTMQSFAAYWVHRLMHRTPILWRVHRVHHSDHAVDVSTSLRNHPLELLLVVPVETAVVLLLGAPVSAVVAVQTLLAAAGFWQHADIRLPPRLERTLARVIITPRLHRLHHNPERAIHDRNYGDFFIWWDRWFGTLDDREGRARVGLDGEVARPDSLIEQLCSPLYAARGRERADMGTLRS